MCYASLLCSYFVSSCDLIDIPKFAKSLRWAWISGQLLIYAHNYHNLQCLLVPFMGNPIECVSTPCLQALVHWWITHWGRMTHICSSKLTIIGSDNGLSPVRRQPIIRTSDDSLLTRPWGIYFNEILFEIQRFSFKKIDMKMSRAKMSAILSWPQCVTIGPWPRTVSQHWSGNDWVPPGNNSLPASVLTKIADNVYQ